MLQREIPRTGELLPVIGLGTWQTFDVSPSSAAAGRLPDVLRRFAAAGGTVIDSSPMYGRAEEVVGALRGEVPNAFLATKVWTRGREAGIDQMNRSFALMRTERVDLMQVHNLVDWRTHLATLRAWKAEGRVRYLGVTHYQTAAFDQLETIIRGEPIDFVQLPFSLTMAEAERALLPAARDCGVAVLVNRPFEEGAVFRDLRRMPVPEWAADFDCRSWSELFLLYVVSHPAVTCAIPATGNPAHMEENLRAGAGRVLNERERFRLRGLVMSLAR